MVTLSKSDKEYIVQSIQQGGSKPIAKLTIRSSKHQVYFQGHILEVIYDKSTKDLREYQLKS